MIPSGWSQTYPSNNGPLNVTLTAGETVTGENFFVKQNPTIGSIGGFVFNDLDSDGVMDPGETGISGRTVYIDLDNDVVLDANEKTTTTNSAGAYLLTNLPAGAYKVREVIPTGSTQTYPLNGFGLNVTLTGGQNATGKNFGIKQTIAAQFATISGTIYNDLDGDGAKDANEVGLSGRTVFIDLDNDNSVDVGEKTATTNASGTYTLSGLRAGTYKVFARCCQQAGARHSRCWDTASA